MSAHAYNCITHSIPNRRCDCLADERQTPASVETAPEATQPRLDGVCAPAGQPEATVWSGPSALLLVVAKDEDTIMVRLSPDSPTLTQFVRAGVTPEVTAPAFVDSYVAGFTAGVNAARRVVARNHSNDWSGNATLAELDGLGVE